MSRRLGSLPLQSSLPDCRKLNREVRQENPENFAFFAVQSLVESPPAPSGETIAVWIEEILNLLQKFSCRRDHRENEPFSKVFVNSPGAARDLPSKSGRCAVKRQLTYARGQLKNASEFLRSIFCCQLFLESILKFCSDAVDLPFEQIFATDFTDFH